MNISFSRLLVARLSMVLAVVFFASCKKDDDNNGTSGLGVTSVKSDTSNLAGATVANGVSTTADIVIVFSRAVDAASASASTITFAPAVSGVTATTSGSTVTVKHDPLATGTNYTLTIKDVKATDGGSTGTKTYSFKSYGAPNVTPPQEAAQVGYWNFNANSNEASGKLTTSFEQVGWGADRFGFANSAAMFNGTTDIIEVDNGGSLISPSTSISFWLKIDTAGSKQGDFVMGIDNVNGLFYEFNGDGSGFKQFGYYKKADNTNVGNDGFFNGDGKDKSNGGWPGADFRINWPAPNNLASMLINKWANVIYTYNAATRIRTVYVNGTKAEVDNFNNITDLSTITGMTTVTAPPLAMGKLAFGFANARANTSQGWADYSVPTQNHFKGGLDDVRFFNVALSDAEVTALYNAEKP